MAHIVPHGITQDMGEGLGGRDIKGCRADYGDKLTFIVEGWAWGVLGLGWNRDGGGGPSEGGRGLVEENRVGGKGHIRLD